MSFKYTPPLISIFEDHSQEQIDEKINPVQQRLNLLKLERGNLAKDLREIRQNEIEEEITSEGMRSPNFRTIIHSSKSKTPSKSRKDLENSESLKFSIKPFELEELNL